MDSLPIPGGTQTKCFFSMVRIAFFDNSYAYSSMHNSVFCYLMQYFPSTHLRHVVTFRFICAFLYEKTFRISVYF